MTVSAFDTRAAVKDLLAAGVDTAEADAIIATMYRAMNELVATSGDVRALGARLDTELKAINARLDTQNAELKAINARLDTELKAINARLDTHDIELKVISTRLDHMVTKGEFYRAVGAAVLSVVGLTTGLVFAVLRVVV